LKKVQWCSGGQHRAVNSTSVRLAINEILAGSGLTDFTAQPLTFRPHDFRRIFTTEAIMNGMPPHTQLLLGHKDINTTMGQRRSIPRKRSPAIAPSSPAAEPYAPPRNTESPLTRNGTNSSATSSGDESLWATAGGHIPRAVSTSTAVSGAHCCALTRGRNRG
jgi:hypothetical protein